MAGGKHLHGGINQGVEVAIITCRTDRHLARCSARGFHLTRGLCAYFLQPANIDVLQKRVGIAVSLRRHMGAVETNG
ncbi:hypothetical protein D3C84_666990 [compost metagenome]